MVFHVYDKRNLARIPRRYTVEAGKMLFDKWAVPKDGEYDLWVLGPNGFVRSFTGAVDRTPVVMARPDPARREIALAIRNSGTSACRVEVRDDHYASGPPLVLTVAPGKLARRSWPLARDHDWYDLTLAGDGFQHRLAGRVETGSHGISDPAAG